MSSDEIVRRHRFLGDDQERLGRDQRNGLEILQQVELERIDRAARDVGPPLADADRVAVGRRARDTADTDGAARTGDVLDDDGLAEGGAHALGHDARDHVRRAAAGERHDHGDGPRRIGLRRCAGGERKAHGEHGRGSDEPSHHTPPATICCFRQPSPTHAGPKGAEQLSRLRPVAMASVRASYSGDLILAARTSSLHRRVSPCRKWVNSSGVLPRACDPSAAS